LGAPRLWYARYGSKNWFEDYKNTIDGVLGYGPVYTSLNVKTTTPEPCPFASEIVLLPIQIPFYRSLSTSRAESVTPESMRDMQLYLFNASHWASAKAGSHRAVSIPWTFLYMMNHTAEAYDSSGLHVVDSVADRQVNILLNKWCNMKAARAGYSYNRTCCSRYPMQVLSQWILQFLGFIGFPFLHFRHRAWLRRESYSRTGMVLQVAHIFSLAVVWCFDSDRTWLFDKVNKKFDQTQLLGAFVVCAIIGLASFTKNTERVSQSKSDGKDVRHSGVLSRSQTEEWKGWMQCIVLLYRIGV
jgi:N-acetylneuraminate 9-O-acetyltransferase